jgi:hypothetical protein
MQAKLNYHPQHYCWQQRVSIERKKKFDFDGTGVKGEFDKTLTD